jgi:hypothetical protein
MGSRLVKFSFTPGENEQIEAVVKVPEERRSIIHGTVKDHKNRNVKDAVVKLFEVSGPNEECRLKPITHTFTDDCGQFLFGPLIACKQYVIKVWINNIKIRELIIKPDDDNKPNDEGCKPYKSNSHKPCYADAHYTSVTTYEENNEDKETDNEDDD